MELRRRREIIEEVQQRLDEFVGDAALRDGLMPELEAWGRDVGGDGEAGAGEALGNDEEELMEDWNVWDDMDDAWDGEEGGDGEAGAGEEG
jgi:hypothetical protein